MSEPTGGWTDAWPRWGLYVLAFAPGVVASLTLIVSGIGHSNELALVGGCLLVPSLPLAIVGSLCIVIDNLGYVSLEYANRHETRAARREVRRKECRAKRLCKERGLARMWKPQFGGGHWGSWTETLAKIEVKEVTLTPQELFVKGDITMEDLERLLSHGEAVRGEGHD